MGANRTPMARMVWISDLGGMLKSGTVVRLSCQSRVCGHWWDADVAALAERLGPSADLRDHPQVCERCGGATNILASPGLATPFRPVRHEA